MDCSVVIPVYNSALMLPELIAQLGEILPTVSQHYEVGTGQRWEPGPELECDRLAESAIRVGARNQHDAQLRAAQCFAGGHPRRPI